jgi:rhamnogalacturonyl hydrolase YesR
MLRPIRRALRQWRQEFSTFWGRFNTFRRMAIGIVVAMLMTYGGRRALLDKRVKEVKALAKELTSKGVPETVPDRSADEEVQNAELKAENLKASREQWGERVAQAKAGLLTASDPSGVDTVTTLDRILTRQQLIVHRRTEEPDDEKCPIPCSCHRYQTVGTFAGILGFLREASQLRALCRCEDLRIEAPPGGDLESAATAEPQLRLSFRFTVMRP